MVGNKLALNFLNNFYSSCHIKLYVNVKVDVPTRNKKIETPRYESNLFYNNL